MLRTSPIGTYQLVLTVLPLIRLVAVFCSEAIRANNLKRTSGVLCISPDLHSSTSHCLDRVEAHYGRTPPITVLLSGCSGCDDAGCGRHRIAALFARQRRIRCGASRQ